MLADKGFDSSNLKEDRRAHVKDMHQRTKLHYLADRRHILTLTQVYKCINGLAPQKLSQQIKLRKDQSVRSTRSSDTLEAVVPNIRLDICRKSFRYRGPWYWNFIDDEIRISPSLETFKRRLYKSDTFATV